MVDTEHVGARLAQERKRLGWTSERAGEIGGVSRRTQSFYESGERLPDAGYLIAVAKEGMDVYFVLTGMRLNTVDVELMQLEQQLEAGSLDHLMLLAKLDALRPQAGQYQLARIELLADVAGNSKARVSRSMNVSDLARKSQLARERAAALAEGGLMLEVLATAYYHGITDEGAAALAAMLSPQLAGKN